MSRSAWVSRLLAGLPARRGGGGGGGARVSPGVVQRPAARCSRSRQHTFEHLRGCISHAWRAAAVQDMMTTGALRFATPDQPLSSAASKLDKVTGLAVLDDSNAVVGVISIRDINRLRKQVRFDGGGRHMRRAAAVGLLRHRMPGVWGQGLRPPQACGAVC